MIGGYPDVLTVRLVGGVLVWGRADWGSDPDEEVRIVPTPTQWTAFGAALDEIGVWRWKRRYDAPPGTVDGTSWDFRIVWGDRRLESSGSNAYPGSRRDDAASPAFMEFTDAVARLVGGRRFA